MRENVETLCRFHSTGREAYLLCEGFVRNDLGAILAGQRIEVVAERPRPRTGRPASTDELPEILQRSSRF